MGILSALRATGDVLITPRVSTRDGCAMGALTARMGLTRSAKTLTVLAATGNALTTPGVLIIGGCVMEKMIAWTNPMRTVKT